MATLIPVLNKQCPSFRILNTTTGMCDSLLANPFVMGIGGLMLGIVGFQAAKRTSAAARNVMLAVSGAAGAGALAFFGASQFEESKIQAQINPQVVTARRQQDVLRAQRSTLQIARPVCAAGCVCVSNQTQWCSAAKSIIQPATVQSLVTFTSPEAAAPKYNFVNDVAQWVGYSFSYKADPAGDSWCGPSVVLSQKGGDCEDLAALVVSILAAGKVTSNLVVGIAHDPLQGTFGHAWVEGRDALGFYLIEATDGVIYRGYRPSIYTPLLQVSSNGTCS